MDGFLIIFAIVIGIVLVAILFSSRNSSESRGTNRRHNRGSTRRHHDPNLSILGTPVSHDTSSPPPADSHDDRYSSYVETSSGDCGTGWDSGGDAGSYDAGGGFDGGGCSDGGGGE